MRHQKPEATEGESSSTIERAKPPQTAGFLLLCLPCFLAYFLTYLSLVVLPYDSDMSLNTMEAVQQKLGANFQKKKQTCRRVFCRNILVFTGFELFQKKTGLQEKQILTSRSLYL